VARNARKSDTVLQLMGAFRAERKWALIVHFDDGEKYLVDLNPDYFGEKEEPGWWHMEKDEGAGADKKHKKHKAAEDPNPCDGKRRATDGGHGAGGGSSASMVMAWNAKPRQRYLAMPMASAIASPLDSSNDTVISMRTDGGVKTGVLKTIGSRKRDAFINDNTIVGTDRSHVKGVLWDGGSHQTSSAVLFRPTEYNDVWVVLETKAESQLREKVSSIICCMIT
jgi:hypothetical protein